MLGKRKFLEENPEPNWHDTCDRNLKYIVNVARHVFPLCYKSNDKPNQRRVIQRSGQQDSLDSSKNDQIKWVCTGFSWIYISCHLPPVAVRHLSM
jgi:hypothetical protein